MRKASRAFSRSRRLIRKGAMTKWQGSLQARAWKSRQKSRKRYQKYKVGK